MAPARRQLPYASTHPCRRARGRPALQVIDAAMRPCPQRPAESLAQMTPEEIEALATAREIDQPRLLRLQLEPETREHGAHPLPGFLDRRFRGTHHHKIVSVADQRAQVRTPVLPQPVEDMQVDVGQQRRDHPALRGARRRASPPALLHHTRGEPLPQQLQHPPIRDSQTYQLEQLRLIDAVKVGADIRVQRQCADTDSTHSVASRSASLNRGTLAEPDRMEAPPSNSWIRASDQGSQCESQCAFVKVIA